MTTPRIAICDDEKAQLDVLERRIRECAYWSGSEPAIDRFCNGESLVRRVADGVVYAYIFLDIHMPDCDGIDTYAQIQKISPHHIIFVSIHAERQPDIDNLFPAMLLCKPYTTENLNNLMIAYNARIAAMNPLVYYSGIEMCEVSIADIVFISTEKDCLIIHLRDGNKRVFDTTLDRIMSVHAGQGLFRCHKSFIINSRYYTKNTYKAVHLRSGDMDVDIPLSRGIVGGHALEKMHRDFGA
jgi:DNA-binding LytR/AlgR family response regulator